MYSIASLFPTPVYVNTIEGLQDSDIEYLKSLDYEPNAGGNLTSINSALLDEVRFSNLKRLIEENLNTYLEKVISPASDVKLKLTQSWANKNPKNTGHHKHSHANSIVSGVFYAYPETISSICFEQMSKSKITVDVKTPNSFNSESYRINCSKNMLVLFPSYLDHFVEDNLVEDDRISIAFNSFYTGSVGNKKALTFLELV